MRKKKKGKQLILFYRVKWSCMGGRAMGHGVHEGMSRLCRLTGKKNTFVSEMNVLCVLIFFQNVGSQISFGFSFSFSFTKKDLNRS